MSTGSAVERVMDEVLEGAGLPNLALSLFTTKQLHDHAMQVRPGRVKNVAEKLNTTIDKLARTPSPHRYLDRVYGLDALVQTQDQGKLITLGFDWTSNANEVNSKMSKLEEFKPLWEGLGILAVAVVLIELPSDFGGLGLMQKYQLLALGDNFDLEVLYPLAESKPGSVQSYTIGIK